MKKILIALILMCTVILPNFAAEKVYFKNLTEAVAFITRCLDSNDQKSLSEACVGERQLTGNSIPFEGLKAINKKTPLKKLYSNKTFPNDKDEFTLGGHASELGHIHIDYKKIDGKWYLKDIWMCK